MKTEPITLEPVLREALIAKLMALADDELLLAQRNAEWTGHAPILEEDIAIANLAQDELGHATVWYGLRHDLDGSDPDALAFQRQAREFRNAQLLELPRGDWAFTLLRQFLFDSYEVLHLGSLRQSKYAPLADACAKISQEERFHLQHSRLWVERLGLGTSVSRSRTQTALNELWAYTPQLFLPLPTDAVLIRAGFVPDLEKLRGHWLEQVVPFLERCGLVVPPPNRRPISRSAHSKHLDPLVQEIQSVARADPEALAW
jgi:ring-1,2-phenylacetyl-CoA epoxidase subunit PaaC